MTWKSRYLSFLNKIRSPLRNTSPPSPIIYIHEETPAHPESWVATYDSRGYVIAITYAQDPTHYNSYMSTVDADGNELSRIYSLDSARKENWMATYDLHGNAIYKPFSHSEMP